MFYLYRQLRMGKKGKWRIYELKPSAMDWRTWEAKPIRHADGTPLSFDTEDAVLLYLQLTGLQAKKLDRQGVLP